MDIDAIKNQHIKLAIKECQEQIEAARLPAPDPSPLWFGCFLFFAILLFPFLIFPLLSKWQEAAPIVQAIDISKFEALLSKNSVHILFYALPAAIVVTHGISAATWRAANSEVMRLRLYKLALLRLSAVIETDEIRTDTKLPELLLTNAFDVQLSSLSVTREESTKAQGSGVPSVDLLVKAVDRIEKQLAQPSLPKTAG